MLSSVLHALTYITVTSHFAPTSTRLTNSPQVGHRPTILPACPTETCSTW